MSMADRPLSRLRPETLDRIRASGAAEEALVELTTSLGMSDNQARDILDLLADTAARHQLSIAAVLNSPELAAIVDRKMGRSDKIKVIKSTLRRLRYPQLTAALDRIDLLSRQLELPGGVRVELPENLEGEQAVVTVQAASAKELRERVAALADCLGGDTLDTIFEIWKGTAE